jgi:hypothetical protein
MICQILVHGEMSAAHSFFAKKKGTRTGLSVWSEHHPINFSSRPLKLNSATHMREYTR